MAAQPREVQEIKDAKIVAEFEVIDDVIPLGDDGMPLVETNEVEIIDEPIIDLDYLSGYDDDVIPLDD